MPPLFYVVAPPYDAASAGSRVLYGLVQALNSAGCDAFAVLHPGWEEPRSHLGPQVPRLTAALAELHYKLRRSPVVVFPEALEPLDAPGVRVLYALNVPGLLGGSADGPPADFVYAYGRDLESRLPRCDGVLFLPASDPEFWSPDPEVARVAPCVYEGKFVAQHAQAIPEDLRGYRRIGRWSPAREEVREILRASTCCYIFENTALATEAALCGCPVVFRTNTFFHGLLAATELGTCGFTSDDSPGALAQAQAQVSQFRASYQRAMAAFPQALHAFIEQTSRPALESAPDSPFELPSWPVRSQLSSSRPPSTVLTAEAGADIWAAAGTELDVALAYNVCLAREAETSAALSGKAGMPIVDLIRELVGSAEFQQRIAEPLRSGGGVACDVRILQSQDLIQAWLLALLQDRECRSAAGAPPWGWRAFAAMLLHDPGVRRRLLGVDPQRLTRSTLDRFVAALAAPIMRGHIDAVGSGVVRGWVLDLADAVSDPALRVRVSSRPVAEIRTGRDRGDVARRFGGSGRAGFEAQLPASLVLQPGDEVSVEHAETAETIAAVLLDSIDTDGA